MKHESCSKILLLILAATCMSAGQGNFKKGDSWEYEYKKNAYSYYGPTPYDQSTDTMVGKITVRIDSVVQHPDSSYWYLNLHDSISVWQKKGVTGGYKFQTKTFTLDSTYRQIITTSKGPDTTMYWEYSMGLAPTGISSDFVASGRLPDTSMSWSENGCSPVCLTTVQRKTSTEICQINGKNSQLLKREADKSYSIGDSINGANDKIETSWSDSVGLCRKILLNTYSIPVAERPQNPKTGSNYERFILLKHNGFAITILPTSAKPMGLSRPYAQVLTKSAPAYFDLRGRRLYEKHSRVWSHGIAIRRFPDGQYDLKCIVR